MGLRGRRSELTIMVRKIVFYLLSIEFPVFDFLQVYGNFMERGREELFIEFQDCVKMV